jgi:hypothetical protein
LIKYIFTVIIAVLFISRINIIWSKPNYKEALNLSNQSKQNRKAQMLQQKSMSGSWIHKDFQLDLMSNGHYHLTQKKMTTRINFNHYSNEHMIMKQKGYWWIDFNLKQSSKVCLSYLLSFHCYLFKYITTSTSKSDKIEFVLYGEVFELKRNY